MKTLNVKLDDRSVDIPKLPIGEYAELLKAIKQLPKHFRTIENLDKDKIIENLPTILGDCLPDVIGVLSIATRLPKEEIEQMGLDEISKLVAGVFEVNNFAGVYELLKKVTTHQAAPQQISKLNQSKTN